MTRTHKWVDAGRETREEDVWEEKTTGGTRLSFFLKNQKLPDEESKKSSLRKKASTPKMAISYKSQAHILFPNWVPETAWCIEESLLMETLLSQLLHTEREAGRQAGRHSCTHTVVWN